MLTPEKCAAWRTVIEQENPPSVLWIYPADILYLLDAADERDRLAATTERVRELHGDKWVCGNPRHTNPEVGCPDCVVVCESCGVFHPCPTIRALDEAGEES